MGMKVYELQHGITYCESRLYSGYRDEMFIPDFFLAFGDNKPLDVYGIDESRIINVGWALADMLSMQKSYKHRGLNDILVISEPEVTDKILSAVMKLSENNPDCNFYIRPHPAEILNNTQLEAINCRSNIYINDNTQYIAITLMEFTHVIGENSTVLYEALSVKKKVAMLYMSGLSPMFLEEADKKFFWHIHSQDDFRKFLAEDITIKADKSIYSKFDKEKVQKLFNN